MTSRTLLAIDPGFVSAGYAIIRVSGTRGELIACSALVQSSSRSLESRLLKFSDFFESLLVSHAVTDLALETPFLGKNAQNFLKLGYLRGALLLLAARYNLQLHEASPREIKRNVTGCGSADKEQVARTVLRFFPMLSDNALSADATDALALAFSLLSRISIVVR